MAPIKLEEHIKESLEKRRIEPSTNAWSQLSGQLDREEQKSKPKVRLWLAAAASIVGVIFVATTVFNSESSTEVSPQLVEVETTEDSAPLYENRNATEKSAEEPIIVDNVKSVETTSEVKSIRSIKTKAPIVETIKQNQKKTIESMQIDTRIANNTDEVENNSAIINTKSQVEIKLEEAMAQVNTKKLNNEPVTDAYVDSLLQSALASVKTEPLINKDGRVDANLLLAEVELDLERSFRDKMYDALKTGFEEIRTAVVNRNQ